MTSRDKAGVIIVMWLIAAALSLVAMIDRPIELWNALLVMALIGSAVGGSIAITTGTKTIEAPQTDRAEMLGSAGKAKNSDTALVDRLISSMSEEELAALRRRLSSDEVSASDDGELISLQDALSKRRR